MRTALFYEKHVFVCLNEREDGHPRRCCLARGSKDMHSHMKKRIKQAKLQQKIRINKAGCLNRCELGPVLVVYPEGIWYHAETEADIDAIVEQHLIGGQVVEHLQITPDQELELRPEQRGITDAA